MIDETFAALNQRFQAGDPSAADAIVALARSGDPGALHKTAEFRLRGIAGPVDLDEARRTMAKAALAGHLEARRADAYFTGSGIGCVADPALAREKLRALAADDRFAAIQLAFLDHVRCAERLPAAERRTISADPHIELVVGLFSPEECRYIQLLAGPWMKPAMIATADGRGARDPHRDSDNMVVTPMTEDLVIQSVNRCIAEASATGYGWGEPLHVLRYGPGQQYRPHHDAHAFVAVEKRRKATALLYLNDDYGGGETAFPELGIEVRGQVGDLLIFHNLTDEGEPDPRMIHAGRPITSGEKWLATRWIRGADYFGRPG